MYSTLDLFSASDKVVQKPLINQLACAALGLRIILYHASVTDPAYANMRLSFDTHLEYSACRTCQLDRCCHDG